MQPLNLRKVLELYAILGHYVPSTPCQDGVEFISKIVENIVSENKHEDFLISLILMTEQPHEELLKLSSEQLIELFSSGLMTNKILDLQNFCNKVGYHG
jgi:plasmid replication initiation protein